MNLLFALSQSGLTGAETYAISLAQALEDSGHRVSFVSDRLSVADRFSYFPLPIHKNNTSFWGRVRNVQALKKILLSEKIDLIHSHARAANLIADFARKKIPMVVTIHGRWRNHFAARHLPCLGDKTIAICPYLERYLVQEIGIPAQQVVMVPNGINLQRFHQQTSKQENTRPRILYVGRANGQKRNVLLFLLQEVFPPLQQRFSDLLFEIVTTDLDHQDEILTKKLQARHHLAIEWHKNILDLVPLYQRATLVLGSGRVALEALASARSVLAIGESSAPGLLTASNFESAFDNNFGDMGEWNRFQKEKDRLIQDGSKILKEEQLRLECEAFAKRKIQEFDVTCISRNLESLYRNLCR